MLLKHLFERYIKERLICIVKMFGIYTKKPSYRKKQHDFLRRNDMGSSEEKAVREVVDQYIQGTYKGDGKALRNCFHSNAVMSGYLNGQFMTGSPEPFFNDIESNPSMAEGGAPYKGEIVFLNITGNVASVTIKETGFGGGMSFTDYFHLIKDHDSWKIISKTFTSE